MAIDDNRLRAKVELEKSKNNLIEKYKTTFKVNGSSALDADKASFKGIKSSDECCLELIENINDSTKRGLYFTSGDVPKMREKDVVSYFLKKNYIVGSRTNKDTATIFLSWLGPNYLKYHLGDTKIKNLNELADQVKNLILTDFFAMLKSVFEDNPLKSLKSKTILGIPVTYIESLIRHLDRAENAKLLAVVQNYQSLLK